MRALSEKFHKIQTASMLHPLPFPSSLVSIAFPTTVEDLTEKILLIIKVHLFNHILKFLPTQSCPPCRTQVPLLAK
jgi:hypothetical protein